MRSDGRAADALRPVRFEVDFTEQPLSSVLCRVGRTFVLCTVCEEAGVPRFLSGSGRGWLTAEYSMLPGATDSRGEREAARGRPSGRTQEIQRLIGRSLRAVIDLGALGERTLWIDCDVLEADGGTRTAAINGAYLAAVDALKGHRFGKPLPRWPIKEPVGAVSVGVVGSTPVLDLAYAEDHQAAVDMNVVMTASGRFVEVQGTGEGRPFEGDELAALLALAQGGIDKILARAKAVLAQG